MLRPLARLAVVTLEDRSLPGDTLGGLLSTLLLFGDQPAPWRAKRGPSGGGDVGILSGPVTLVATGSTWKYLDNGSNQGTAWRAPGFVDASWASGPAQLGYGDGDETTVVGYGSDANNKYITTYFRKSFAVADPTAYVDATLRLLRDDGAIVSLNGQEVFRSNMPAGAVGHQTLASTGIGGTDETVFLSAALSPAALVAGTNVLAVEIHQAAVNSSDISFDLELKATEPVADRIAVIGDFSAGQPAADVAALVRGWNPAFVVTVGDNNYPSGSAATIDANIGQYYHNYIAPYTGAYGPGGAANRFFPALGNHDWDAPTGSQPYRDYFALPGNERYYDVALGSLVRLFVVDSDPREPDGVTANSVQGQWLQARLAAATEPWKLVAFHHPPYNSGAAHGSEVGMRWPFKEWGASAVLTGHEHVYERLFVDGLPYFVDGLGGHSIYTFNAPINGSLVRYNGDYGALLIDASASRLSFQFANRAGTVIDSYALNDPKPTVTVTATDSQASETGSNTATFALARTGSTAEALPVSYALGGSAASSDYSPLSGTVVIPAGAASATVTLTPVDDALVEGTETATLSLVSSPAYAVGTVASATATILDDDFRAKINFQPANAPIPSGYVVDSGSVYGNRGNGLSYGWKAANPNVFDRNSPLSADQRYDTGAAMQLGGIHTWEIGVPLGSYRVRVVAGDAAAFDSVYRIRVETALAVSGTPTSAARWVEGTTRVSVTDGKLTVASFLGAVNNKIDFVEITAVGDVGARVPQ